MAENADSKAEAIFHPVRIRIVQALSGGARLTPAKLAAAAGQTPIATLYRHLNRLARAGVVVVVGERKVRGTVERTYALANDRAANVPRGELRRLGRRQLLRHFTTLVTTLLDDYGRYLAGPSADVVRDGVVLRQESLALTRAEAEAVRTATLRAIAPFLRNADGAGRRRYLLTTLLLPEATAGSVSGRQSKTNKGRRGRGAK
jgi:DNA-binding transcriptional ArsR family regulator